MSSSVNREKKFTPGPWEVHNNADVITSTGEHFMVPGTSSQDIIANANLISACTELLKELESHCQACMERNNFENGCSGCFTQRAIKKAYGETE